MSTLINTSRLAPRAAAILVLTAGLLAGCGGGSDVAEVAVDATAMPESAAATSAAALSFAKSQADSDTSEPLTLAQAELPTSETAEPDAL